jgi:hypothetical protein
MQLPSGHSNKKQKRESEAAGLAPSKRRGAPT